MKNNILKKLTKKYGMGGMTPPTSSNSSLGDTFKMGLKGVKPLLRGAFRGALGVPGMMLNATSLNASPGPFTESINTNPIEGPSGNNMSSFYTSIPKDTVIPNSNAVTADLTNAMNPYYKKQMGGVNLPGGIMTSIPGTDAVEFTGQSHDDGGIQVDEQTEVEGGETMDKVVMSKGGPKDYFFSDHLKKGGMSYAEQHKNILEKGGTQEDINLLAKMQEKAAGRNPKQVAKLGGVVKYEEGGLSDLEKAKRLTFMMQNNPEYTIGANNLLNESGVQPPLPLKSIPPFGQRFDLPSKQDLESIYSPYQRQRQINEATPYNTTTYGPNFSPQNLTVPPNNMGATPIGGNFAPNVNYGGNNPLDLDRRMTEQIQPMDLQKMGTDVWYDSAYPERELPSLSLNPNMNQSNMSQEEIDLAGGTDNTYDAYLARTEMSGEEAISEKKYNRQQKIAARKLNRKLNPGMPVEAQIGAAAQFLPGIAAMFTNQKDYEKFKYESGFNSPIVAGRVKGLKYEAPNQNEARARLASSYTGEQKFLDTSGAGAAGISNRQALFAKKLQAEGTLGAQESKDKLTAENLTKKSAEQANIRNVQNELSASTTNAQLSQREADRKAAVDNANTQLKNAQQNEKVTNRMSILNNFSQGISGVMGDTMAYKADERIAKATGLYGVYERDRFSETLKGKINPKTGNIFTEKDIAALYLSQKS